MGNLCTCFRSGKGKAAGRNQRTPDVLDAGVQAHSNTDQKHHINRLKDDVISTSPKLGSERLNKHANDVNAGLVAMDSIRRATKGYNSIPNTTENRSSHQLSENEIITLFNKYKDPEEDAIMVDGIERLCQDLQYNPDEFAILVLAWRLDASEMCRFTKTEFMQGLRTLKADSIGSIRSRLEEHIDKLKTDSDLFKQLYRFTFRFGLEPDNRIVQLDMAIILWRLVFTVHTPPILDRWLNYLELHTNIRGIPKDTWNMFLNFAETCDITQYDDTEAWPSLFDDFVEYENDCMNQNVVSDIGSDMKKD